MTNIIEIWIIYVFLHGFCAYQGGLTQLIEQYVWGM